MNTENMAHHLAIVLEEMGIDLHDPQTCDTPIRWAKVLAEFGVKDADVPNLKSFPNEGKGTYSGLVYDRCELYSLCSHHMLPVIGTAHIAYIPAERVLGLSKLSRIADHFARQPTMQEMLTQDIADYIEAQASPKGVAVFIEAKHLCKCMRGIAKQEGLMATTVLRGAFLEKDKARQEFEFYCGRSS